LAFALIEAMLANRPFLGRSASCRGVLVLSEERPVTIAEKARRFHQGSGAHLLTRDQAHGVRWLTVVEQAVAYSQQHGLDVLVVDTWDKWTGLKGDEENKAGTILTALDPLMRAASTGLAVVVVAHQRKASGELGEAVRGSNALTGGVDVVVEIERTRSESQTVRVLQAVSRFGSTPDRLVIELEDTEYRLADLETSADSQNAAIDDAIAAADRKPSASEIAAETGIGESTVRRRLEGRRDAGEVARTGTGRKGDPYRWASSPIVCTGRNLLGDANNPNRPYAATVNTPTEQGALIERIIAEFDAVEEAA
jgi:AAA domain